MFDQNAQNAVRQMERAGLRARYMQVPFIGSLRGQSAENIFQMDIENRNSKSETIRVYPGAGSNMTVSDVNKSHKQVMMHIKEPARRFTEELQYWSFERREQLKREIAIAGRSTKLVSDQGSSNGHGRLVVERTTPAATRHMLVGHDEIRYFICSVPGGPATVEAAHRALRPKEANKPGTKRQGEWFLVPLGGSELTKVDKLIQEDPVSFQKDEPLFRVAHNAPSGTSMQQMRRITSGTPHMASSLFHDVKTDNVYAKGKITQDMRHTPLHLTNWHLVVRNLELLNPISVNWFD